MPHVGTFLSLCPDARVLPSRGSGSKSLPRIARTSGFLKARSHCSISVNVSCEWRIGTPSRAMLLRAHNTIQAHWLMQHARNFIEHNDAHSGPPSRGYEAQSSQIMRRPSSPLDAPSQLRSP